MSTPVDRLRATFDEQFTAASTDADVKALRDQYLGRKGGAVAALMKDVASAPPAERPALGRLANELKQFVEQALAIAPRHACRVAAAGRRRGRDAARAGRLPFGRRHPLTWLRERIEAIFARQGYEILDGAETEDDWHNFEALNMPPDHPARDMQDTLYLREPLARGVWTAGGTRLADDPAAPPRSCAPTPPRCRSATWSSTARRCASSRPAACTAATTSTSRTPRCSSRSRASSSAKASPWRT